MQAVEYYLCYIPLIYNVKLPFSSVDLVTEEHYILMLKKGHLGKIWYRGMNML